MSIMRSGVCCKDAGLFVLQLPTIIADNAGYDSAELVSQLRAAHQDNKSTFGLGKTRTHMHISPE